MFNKKISLGVLISIVLIAITVTFSLTMIFSLNRFNEKLPNIKQRETMYSKIAEIDLKVRENYLGEIDEQLLFEYISRGYIEGIDDNYAKYYDQEAFKDFQESMAGKRVGIGLMISADESGYLKIANVLENSPAKMAGLQINDLIISVDGIDLKTVTDEQAEQLILGDVGTAVTLVVRREGTDTEYNVIRKNFDVISVESRVENEIACIRITDFNEKTVNQFKDAVDLAIKDGEKGIIFDLRNNTGGSLDAAVKMLDILVPEGTIASKVTKSGEKVVIRESDADEVTLPMVCLVNGYTASASELFVSVLRDFNKVKLVGTNTYGKGVMQETYKLNDGSAISFTTAQVVPPSEQSFDKVGLKPDFEVALPQEQQQNFYALDDNNDPQFTKALEVISAAIG